MPRPYSPEVTAFVRYALIGESRDNAQLARDWGCSTAAITTIRSGKSGVGPDIARGIAKFRYGKVSLAPLEEEAHAWVEAHPEFFGVAPIIQQAVGRLAMKDPGKAKRYADVAQTILAFDNPEDLTVEQAELLILAELAKAKGKAAGERALERATADKAGAQSPAASDARTRHLSLVVSEADRELRSSRSVDSGEADEQSK